MRCPFCQTDNDRVLDSRSSEEGYAIRRRRECMQCKRRYTTYERLEELAIKVVKKDGIREPFSREKIRLGLARACWKAATERRPDRYGRGRDRERRLRKL